MKKNDVTKFWLGICSKVAHLPNPRRYVLKIFENLNANFMEVKRKKLSDDHNLSLYFHLDGFYRENLEILKNLLENLG